MRHVAGRSGVDDGQHQATWRLERGSVSWRRVAFELASRNDIPTSHVENLAEEFRGPPRRVLRVREK